MSQTWRISSFNGALLACYFVPTWSVVTYRFMMSPVQGLYEQPNVSLALFLSDHLNLATMTTIRFGWLLALAKLTVVAFFVIFLTCAARASIRKSGGCDEPLALALGIGSLISFISMLMASQVGEAGALRLHATELLMMLGTAILMTIERPSSPAVEEGRERPSLDRHYPSSSPSS